MMDVITRYYCPNCDQTLAVKNRRMSVDGGKRDYHTHICPGLGGMHAPFIVEGVDCKVEAQVRDDFVGGDLVAYDEHGRPITAVTTTRDDGQDSQALLPCATLSASRDLGVEFDKIVQTFMGGTHV